MTGILGAPTEGVKEWSTAVDIYTAQYVLGKIVSVIKLGSVYDKCSHAEIVPPPTATANVPMSSRIYSDIYWDVVPSITSEHIAYAHNVDEEVKVHKAN